MTSARPACSQRRRRGNQCPALATQQAGLIEIGDGTLESREVGAADLAAELIDCQATRVLVEQIGEGEAAEPLIVEVGGCGGPGRSGCLGGGGHDLNLRCEPLPGGAVGNIAVLNSRVFLPSIDRQVNRCLMRMRQGV